jgi:predicted enzyme related to lactoylglutathione lyase
MVSVVWVEVPVRDFDRALTFYQAVFELASTQIIDDGVRRTTTLFSSGDSGEAGFSLNQTANFEPSDKGPLVYLYAGDDLAPILERVEAHGGAVVEGKTSMGSAGFYATIRDTEGNMLALYAAQ